MHTGDVMPDIYRAPEVILGMDWDSKIDIWCVGLMVSGNSTLFHPLGESNTRSDLGSVRGP